MPGAPGRDSASKSKTWQQFRMAQHPRVTKPLTEGDAMHRDASRRMGILAVALVMAGLLAGCERTKISDINRDPGSYSNKEVTIAGEVTTAFGALNQGAFELDDGTGRLWVVSSGFGVPSQGAKVAVTGRVQSGVTVGTRSFANVLRETKPRQGAD